MKYRVGSYNNYHCKDGTVSIIALIILFVLIQGCLLYSNYSAPIATVTEPTTHSTLP